MRKEPITPPGQNLSSQVFDRVYQDAGSRQWATGPLSNSDWVQPTSIMIATSLLISTFVEVPDFYTDRLH